MQFFSPAELKKQPLNEQFFLPLCVYPFSKFSRKLTLVSLKTFFIILHDIRLNYLHLSRFEHLISGLNLYFFKPGQIVR